MQVAISDGVDEGARGHRHLTVPNHRDDSGELSYVVRVADSDSIYVKRAKTTLREGRRGARRKVTPDVLRRVAAVYAQDELRPAEAVQRAFDVSPRTAYRYIWLAREGGYFTEKDAKA